jgi:hypothetical protein
MEAQRRRLWITIAASPVGILGSVVLGLAWPVSDLSSSVNCVTTERAVAGGLETTVGCPFTPSPPWVHVVFFMVAFGPGIVATYSWFRARRSRVLTKR